MKEDIRVNRAKAAFENGFSCSQAVFAAFAVDLGLDRNSALRLSQAMGGGMAHLGQTCGAVTGAFLALALKHGRDKAADLASRDRTYELMQRLAAEFAGAHGSLQCSALLGLDLGTAEGMAEARSRGLFQSRCARFVETAARLVEELL